jgi:hypothetical protein
MLNLNEEDDESNDYLPQKENFFSHDFISLNGDIKSKIHQKLQVHDDINFLNQNSFVHNPKNSYIIFNSFELLNSIQGKKKSNSLDFFSGNKRKNTKEKEENEDKENVSSKEEIEDKKIDVNNSFRKMGRRLKDEVYSTEAKHDKFKDDNIIRKIKTFIFKYILIKLNESLEFTKYKFYPLNAALRKNIKKDFNIKLLDRTIFDLYNTEDLNKTYRNGNDSNKILIKKILDENKEKKTIDILNMKFRDVLNHIREKDLENFLGKIKEKEKKNKGKPIDLYMENVAHLLKDFEKWFERKNGRELGKKHK